MNPDMKELVDLLRYKRPGDSTTEEDFVTKWLMPKLPNPQKDEYGNVWVRVGDEKGPTMFSCHTDTVHSNEGMQRVVYDSTKFHLFADNSNCLGADDGTGIWLALHLIRSKVPGLYIFHRDEESGGQGSAYIVKNYAPAFQYIKHCIALDRAGTADLITHQSGRTRCASDTFGNKLLSHLNGYKLCDGGSFTDSFNYRGLIPECINLSVGYYHQHSANEYQDLKFAYQLATMLTAVPWASLPSKREPTTARVYETKPFVPGSYYGNRMYDDGSYASYWNRTSQTQSSTTKTAPARQAPEKRKTRFPTLGEVIRFVQENPRAAAGLLDEFNVTFDDLDYGKKVYGRVNKPVELQQSAGVREVPAGGKKETH
jgi:hypothetical protein